mmetsp:Transcript_1333/g.2086  ORF Transcript_1333/g.2086 Transcript_1333/m.2086 type:complete len:409 (+) Transcript_1333:31-1257(+)
MESEGNPRVQVLLYADDIITSSVFDHENRKLEFSPDRSARSQNERNVPSAIFTNNADAELSESGSSSTSSSSTSSSLTSSPSMMLDKDSKNYKKCPLPIDFQFSLPAMLVLILYCLGHASFYDLFTQTLYFLTGRFEENPMKLHIGLLALGFLVLRTSGEIWYYSSGVVYSDSFYNQFRATKLFRLKLANKHVLQRKDKKIIDSKIQTLKREALVKDIKLQKFFKRHPKVGLVSGLIGYYLVYIPCNYFYSETCLKYVAIPRQDIINELPSVKKQTEGVNPSPIFRSMLSVGPYPLLSKDEMDSWNDRVGVMQTFPDMALRIKHIPDNSQSCSAINGTLESFLALEDSLYYEDEMYLRSKLSSSSYGAFFGDGPAYFISSNGWFAISSIVFGICFILLAKVNVEFFDV